MGELCAVTEFFACFPANVYKRPKKQLASDTIPSKEHVQKPKYGKQMEKSNSGSRERSQSPNSPYGTVFPNFPECRPSKQPMS